MVAVAQLVESQIVILVVVGSSPISHPKNSSNKQAPRCLFCFVRKKVRPVGICSATFLH